MQFLNLEYKTRPAPQAVKRKKEKKHRSETNLMQCARPDDADGDERRAGTPRERGREGEGGEADDNGSNHNNGNKSKRRPKEENRGNGQKQRQGREERANHEPPRHATQDALRTTQIAQKPLTPPKTNFLTQKFLQTFSKDDPLFPKIRGGVAPIRGVAVTVPPKSEARRPWELWPRAPRGTSVAACPSCSHDPQFRQEAVRLLDVDGKPGCLAVGNDAGYTDS